MGGVRAVRFIIMPGQSATRIRITKTPLTGPKESRGYRDIGLKLSLTLTVFVQDLQKACMVFQRSHSSTSAYLSSTFSVLESVVYGSVTSHRRPLAWNIF
jgi:hypothetical protein